MPQFTNKLQDRKVLILGGSAGVGLSVATGVLEFGGIAIIASSNASRVESAVASLKSSVPEASSRVYGTTIDLATQENLDERIIALLEFTKNAHNGAAIDHIVFTAGNVEEFPTFANASAENLQAFMQVRLFGGIFLVKHAAKYLVQSSSSSITFTAGNSKERPKKGWGLVAPLVGTVFDGLVRGVAVDLQPIRSNLITLGMVDTDLLHTIMPKEVQQELAEQSLTKKLASPDDVAEAYLYVIRDQNITGQNITTESGEMLG